MVFVAKTVTPSAYVDVFRNQVRASWDKCDLARLKAVSQDISISKSWRERLKDQLSDIFERTSSENWDGYNAHATSGENFSFAIKFIEMLPEGVQKPDISPEPDGTFSFEWRVSGKPRMLSVSVGKNAVHYAAIMSYRQKEHGEEVFFDSIPENINRLFATYFRDVG
jgi:hypothetical protein